MLPALAPVKAASVSNPTFSFFPGTLQYAGNQCCSDHGLVFNITNPASNTIALKQISVTMASGFTFNTGTNCAGGIFGLYDPEGEGCTTSGVQAVWGSTVGSDYSGALLIPGQTTYLGAAMYSIPAPASYPKSYTFVSSWVDANNNAHTGPSFTFTVFNPAADPDSGIKINGVDYSSTNYNFPADGAPLTITSNIAVANAGIAVTFSSMPFSGYHSGGVPVGTFTGAAACYDASTMCVSYTDSTGTATITFTPSTTIGYDYVYVFIGNTANCPYDRTGYASCDFDQYWRSGWTQVTTIAGHPTSVAFTLASASPVDYSISQFTTINENFVPAFFTGAYFAGYWGSHGYPNGPPDVMFNLQDKFSNPIYMGDANLGAFTISMSASGNESLFDAVNANVGLPTSLQCASGGNWQDTSATPVDLTANGVNTVVCPLNVGVASPMPFDYYQSGQWGTSGDVSATVSGTYAAKAFTVSGSTAGSLVTSTFDTTSNAPTQPDSPGVDLVTAGNSVTLSVELTTPQGHVPITFYLCNPVDNAGCATSTVNAAPYGTNAGFDTKPPLGTTGALSANATTNADGVATIKFYVDTYAGNIADFVTSDVADFQHYASGRLVNGTTMEVFGNGYVQTEAGAPVKFSVVLEYPNSLTGNVGYDFIAGGLDEITYPSTGSVVPLMNMQVDVQITDFYNNEITNPGGQIQLTLAATGCSLASSCAITATNPYIPSGFDDTATQPGSFGPITWVMPASLGAISLTATGFFAGCTQPCHGTIDLNVVSPNPSVAITGAPGPIFSPSHAVLLAGAAAASLGYDLFVNVASVGYKVDSSPWANAACAACGASPTPAWSQGLVLADGLHTVWVNATDAKGNVSAIASVQVLVDTSAPTLAFTTLNNANLTAGANVVATITDSQGDLDFTTVAVTDNSTPLPGAQVGVSPSSNTLGASTVYTVTISGLAAGNHTLILSASDLAGNSGGSVSILVHISVPQNMIFTSTAPTESVVGGIQVISSSWTNNGVAPYTATFTFEIFQGSTPVALSFLSQSVNPGQTVGPVGFSIPSNLASGSYTADLFVTVGGNSYSQVYSLPFTV